MWSAEGPAAAQRGVRSEHAGDALDDRHLERLVIVERRLQARYRAGEHGLARAGRSDEQQAVPSHQGDLERPPGHRLTAHLCQIHWRVHPDERFTGSSGLPDWARDRHRDRSAGADCPASPGPGHHPRRVIQAGDCQDLDAAHEISLRGVCDRDTHAHDARPGERRHHGQDPGDGLDRPVQRELPEQRTGQAGGPDLARRHEDADRDGEIVRGPRFAPAGGRQVDRDPARRIREAAVPDGAADPLASLRQRRVRQPDDMAGRQSGSDVDLDADEGSRDPVNIGRHERCEHGGRLSAAACPWLYVDLPAPLPPLIRQPRSPGTGNRNSPRRLPPYLALGPGSRVDLADQREERPAER
jgi:hypothetical protein